MPAGPRLPAFVVALVGLSASACRKAPPPEPPDTAPPSIALAASATSAAASADAASVTTSVAAPALPALSPDAARDLAKRAAACQDDPRCPLQEAARLNVEAMARGAISLGCYDLYYGFGVPADAPRARACFEAKVATEKACGGTPTLDRSFLGLMLFDAQGGPRDAARARELLSDCVGGEGILGVTAERREKSGETKPIEFCGDIIGNTMHQTECARIDRDRGEFEARRAAKELFAELAVDDAGYALWQRAERAWDRFASRDAAYGHDLWRGGTGAPTIYELTLAAHARGRSEVLRALLEPPAEHGPPDGGEAALRLAYASASAKGDAANKKLLAETQVAWQAYRDAEAAFVGRAFAKRYGRGDVAARALRATLTRRRASALGTPE